MQLTARRALGGAAAVLVAAALSFTARGLWRRWLLTQDLLPTFQAPGPGPRAPTTASLGFVVGKTTLAQAQATLARLGLDCEDTSLRAQMRRLREAKQEELARVAAAGGDPDAVSGASLARHRSPKERNPQVRLSCELVRSEQLTDRPRVAATGRLLLIFDSPRLPLRHVSLQRTFPAAEMQSALADFAGSEEALAASFGAPHARQAGATGARTGFAWLEPVASTWRYRDLSVSVKALSFGARGITIDEIVEVPWPIRPDAPSI